MKKIIAFTLLILSCLNPAYAEGDFRQWLSNFKRDAMSQGITKETLDEAFAETGPLDRVLVLDRKQPESTMTLDEYLDGVVSQKRVSDGRRLYEENYDLLNRIGSEYNVQPRFIVALWGIETNFGKNIGGFSTIDSLSTLAYDGRRSEFFRAELINALKVLQSEDMPASDMKGSWAGALGQCQFMPTSFIKYAVDYNHDGKKDIWNTKADVFASIANYLQSEGWEGNEGWGRPVNLPPGFDRNLADIKATKKLSEWQHMGVRRTDGHALPTDNVDASLIYVGEGEDATPFLIYGNYKVLLKWNRSRLFATGVSMLADKIGQ